MRSRSLFCAAGSTRHGERDGRRGYSPPACAAITIAGGRSVQDPLQKSTYIYETVAGGFVGQNAVSLLKPLFFLYNLA
jgi:hypothetical protein